MKAQSILMENAHIAFRNFSGKAGNYNPEGDRNVCVFLDTKLAKSLEEDNWNIKWLKPNDKDEDPQAYIQAKVSYDNIPPKIVMISSHGRTTLDEESVGLLDFAEISKVDLIIRPYEWTVNGKSGVKAYIKSMYVTIYEDELELKYSEVPDSAVNTMKDDDAD